MKDGVPWGEQRFLQKPPFFLMHLALTDLYRARWTDQIHEEWIRNLLEQLSPKYARVVAALYCAYLIRFDFDIWMEAMLRGIGETGSLLDRILRAWYLAEKQAGPVGVI